MAIYEPYEQKCPEWEYTTEEELIQDHDTVGGVASSNSRTALDAEIWERGYSKYRKAFF